MGSDRRSNKETEMYRKIATAVVTALALATASSAAISRPQTIPASEQAWFERASNPNTH
jgi:hypothetical protein